MFLNQNNFKNYNMDNNNYNTLDEINKQKLKKDKTAACLDLGVIPYNKALDIQMDLFEIIREQNLTGVILLLEHNPVITIGNNRSRENIIVDEDKLKKLGIDIIQSNRGGDVTFHGPGQLVCYPIFNLAKFSRDLTLFVFNLEQIIINTLGYFSIQGQRIKKLRGVFVDYKKIASVGIHVKKWITYHGFSFNVNVELDYFKHIVACGLKEHTQTSLEELLGRQIDIDDIKEIILKNFQNVFGIKVLRI